MAKAFCMITVEGNAINIALQLAGKTGVQSADAIMGQYDIIAVVTAPTAPEIALVVLHIIQPTDGVKKTETCLVIP